MLRLVRRFSLIALVLVLVAGVFPGAAQDDAPTATYVTNGPIGVNPFLQLIADGLTRAGEEFGVTTRVVESADVTQLEDNLRAEIEAGTDLIITVSFESLDAVTRLSAEFPDQRWAIVDASIPDNPNVRGILFREHEGMFLIGALFGRLSESGVVGFVGALDIPPIRRWFVGYEEGVRYANPDATVLEGWATSFNDPATSAELALAQFEQGADYIAGAAAAGNTGVFEAAAEQGFFTSGVDSDQRVLDPERIVESMVKRTDVGVYDAVQALAEGTFEGGIVSYGLAENAVGPAFLILEDAEVESLVPEEVQEEIRELAAQVVAGDIVVTDYLAPAAEATPEATGEATPEATTES